MIRYIRQISRVPEGVLDFFAALCNSLAADPSRIAAVMLHFVLDYGHGTGQMSMKMADVHRPTHVEQCCCTTMCISSPRTRRSVDMVVMSSAKVITGSGRRPAICSQRKSDTFIKYSVCDGRSWVCLFELLGGLAARLQMSVRILPRLSPHCGICAGYVQGLVTC